MQAQVARAVMTTARPVRVVMTSDLLVQVPDAQVQIVRHARAGTMIDHHVQVRVAQVLADQARAAHIASEVIRATAHRDTMTVARRDQVRVVPVLVGQVMAGRVVTMLVRRVVATMLVQISSSRVATMLGRLAAVTMLVRRVVATMLVRVRHDRFAAAMASRVLAVRA